MRKSFVKRLACAALALSMAMTMAIPAFADEQGRVVTFRPGMEGSVFSEEYIAYIENTGYTYEVSQATGSISVLVPIGSPAPNAPDYTDIIPGDSRYQVIDPAEGYQQNDQLSSEHVTQYAMKRQGEDYAYTVEYRDRDTGEEVAPAQRGTSSAVTLTFYAPAIANYRAEADSAALTITAEGPNLLTFWYVAVPITETETVTAAGNTIYRYNDVTVYSTAGVAGGGAGGGAGAGAGAGAGGGEGGGEVINPDETPLTGGETTEPETSGPTEEINPDETPQTNAPEEESSGLSPMVGVGIGLVVLILAVAFFLKRKKDSAAEE